VCAQENLPTYEKLWDIFVQEKTKWKTMSSQREEDQDLALIEKVK
jgi:hypothetical protein